MCALHLCFLACCTYVRRIVSAFHFTLLHLSIEVCMPFVVVMVRWFAVQQTVVVLEYAAGLINTVKIGKGRALEGLWSDWSFLI